MVLKDGHWGLKRGGVCGIVRVQAARKSGTIIGAAARSTLN